MHNYLTSLHLRLSLTNKTVARKQANTNRYIYTAAARTVVSLRKERNMNMLGVYFILVFGVCA